MGQTEELPYCFVWKSNLGGGEGCASQQPPLAAARVLGGATFATSLKERKELEVCAFCGVISMANPVVCVGGTALQALGHQGRNGALE